MSRAPGYQVLIDGYNVVLRAGAPASSAELERRRRAFVQRLHAMRWPVAVARVTVVFDTRLPHSEGLPSGDAVQVRFAHPSADAWMLEALRSAPDARAMLVISDDREILRTARDLGARCDSTAWLLERLAGASAIPPAAAPSSDDAKQSLPAAEARRIRDELLKRWRGG